MGSKNISHYLFEDYIKDTNFRAWVYTPNENMNVFWSDHIKNNPIKFEDIEKAKLFLIGVREYYDSNKIDDIQVEKKYQEFIGRHSTIKSIRPSIFKRNRNRIFNYSVAASILVLISFSLFYSSSYTNSYTTAYGEYKNIELPDGSQVTLGANSKLRLGDDWTLAADRKVYLEGEAYFNVKPIKTNHAKFTVITNDLNVEVLGTSFNVDNRKVDTKVILDEGKIKLNIKDNLNQQLLLNPGEKVVYVSKSRKLPAKAKAKKEETSWRDGVMIYTNTPLNIVLSKIEDIYGIQLKLKPQDEIFRDKEVTVGISITNKEMAVTTIEKVLGITFTN